MRAFMPCQGIAECFNVYLLWVSGIRWSEVKNGTGDRPQTGNVVLIDVLGTTEDGKVFIDTKTAGTPLAFEMGTTYKYITEGLSQVWMIANSGTCLRN